MEKKSLPATSVRKAIRMALPEYVTEPMRGQIANAVLDKTFTTPYMWSLASLCTRFDDSPIPKNDEARYQLMTAFRTAIVECELPDALLHRVLNDGTVPDLADALLTDTLRPYVLTLLTSQIALVAGSNPKTEAERTDNPGLSDL